MEPVGTVKGRIYRDRPSRSKKCTRCGEYKHYTDFSKDESGVLKSTCNACITELIEESCRKDRGRNE